MVEMAHLASAQELIKRRVGQVGKKPLVSEGNQP